MPRLRVETMESILTKAVELPHFNMLLFGVLAGVALLLAVVGIYGLMAYLVAQRKHEIGIRRALGAQRSDVLRLVMGNGLKLIALGLVIGLPAALALTGLIQSWLTGMSSTDPLTVAAAAVSTDMPGRSRPTTLSSCASRAPNGRPALSSVLSVTRREAARLLARGCSAPRIPSAPHRRP